MLSHRYILNESVTVPGKPFHNGGISQLTIHPGKPDSGIQFRFENRDYSLREHLIQARKERTARFNQATFDTFQVKILEHRQSAIIQALGFYADIIIELPRPKLFYNKSILLPYAGGGILKPYDALIAKRACVGQDILRTLKIDRSTKQKQQQFAFQDGNDIHINPESKEILLLHPSKAKLKVSNAANLRTTVHSAKHEDVTALKELDIKPYSTDYVNLSEAELSARALGRTEKRYQHLGASILRATGGYGISSEGYFFATPGIKPKALLQSMQSTFRDSANEHLVHSAVSDIPAELWLLAKHFNVDNLALHFEFRDTTHLSRVSLLKTLCTIPQLKPITNNTKSLLS